MYSDVYNLYIKSINLINYTNVLSKQWRIRDLITVQYYDVYYTKKLKIKIWNLNNPKEVKNG